MRWITSCFFNLRTILTRYFMSPQTSAAARQPRPEDAQARRIRSVNPATGQELRSFVPTSREEIERKIQRSVEAFGFYRKMSFGERAILLLNVASLLEQDKERLGELMTTEMGKPRQAAIDEVLKCARTCRFYADMGERFLADENVPSEGMRSFVAYQPLGPILAIMPWNFPLWQVFRFAAPALMAGNTVLLKHASNVPQCALAIEELLKRAELPEGVFQTLLVGSREVEPILGDPRIMAATLTGSDSAGAQVAETAGRNLKKVVLELGGSDPFIVMPSVDLDFAVRMAVAGRTVNNGESCVAAKRFIVHESIADEFAKRFADAMGKLKVGDPMDPATQIGPLATAEIRDHLSEQVDRCVRDGARVLVGGKRLPGNGFFYEPTVLIDIPEGAPAWKEEFFGPVALVFRAKDIQDAVRIANDNPFGLGSSLWSEDKAEQDYFIREIAAGMAFVNSLVVSDPILPFGGIKRSGYGRELSAHGIREFVNIKTVRIREKGSAKERTGTE